MTGGPDPVAAPGASSVLPPCPVGSGGSCSEAPSTTISVSEPPSTAVSGSGGPPLPRASAFDVRTPPELASVDPAGGSVVSVRWYSELLPGAASVVGAAGSGARLVDDADASLPTSGVGETSGSRPQPLATRPATATKAIRTRAPAGVVLMDIETWRSLLEFPLGEDRSRPKPCGRRADGPRAGPRRPEAGRRMDHRSLLAPARTLVFEPVAGPRISARSQQRRWRYR